MSLTLTRKPKQSFTLTLPSGQTVSVMLVESDRNRARIAIDAPKDVRILRSELVARPARVEDPFIDADRVKQL